MQPVSHLVDVDLDIAKKKCLMLAMQRSGGGLIASSSYNVKTLQKNEIVNDQSVKSMKSKPACLFALLKQQGSQRMILLNMPYVYKGS